MKLGRNEIGTPLIFLHLSTFAGGIVIKVKRGRFSLRSANRI